MKGVPQAVRKIACRKPIGRDPKAKQVQRDGQTDVSELDEHLALAPVHQYETKVNECDTPQPNDTDD